MLSAMREGDGRYQDRFERRDGQWRFVEPEPPISSATWPFAPRRRSSYSRGLHHAGAQSSFRSPQREHALAAFGTHE